jgi:hypothetical protein
MTSLMDATEEGEQNNLRQNSSMNHQMGLKLALAISKLQSRKFFFDAIMPT